MAFSSPRFKGIPRLEAVASNSPTMKYGETSPAVVVIQQALIDAGISTMPISTRKSGSPDGIFKGETRRVVKEFQLVKPNRLNDDGIVGHDTMMKLDDFFKGAPKPVKPTPSKGITLPPLGHSRRDEIIRILRDDAGMTRPKAAEFADALLKFNIARHGVILAEIVGLFGTGTAAVAVAGGAAVLGVIGFAIGSLIALTNAMESGFRIAGNIGFVYGFTAWAFEKSKPGFSKQLRDNIMTSGSAKDIHKFERAWSKGVNKAFDEAPRGRHRILIKGKPVSIDTYRFFLQVFGDSIPGRFSFKMSQEVAGNISDHIERGMFLDAVDSGCMYNL